MIQKTGAYFLLTLYFVAITRPVLPMLDYLVRYEYYAKVLCVNKDKPEMKCNGQCHLSKELKKVAEPVQQEDQKVPVPTVNLDDYPITLIYKSLADIPLFPVFYTEKGGRYQNFSAEFNVNDVFHPPKIIS